MSPVRPIVRALFVPAVLGAFAPAALADRLELTDGRVVEGLVTKEGETYRVISRFGESTVAAKDVKTWVQGKTVEQEWRERLQALKAGDHAGRASLAKWLKEQERPESADALARDVVDADPENLVAREVLGHVRHRGEWKSADDAKRADGWVERGGTWYSPDEWARLDAAAKAKAEESARQEEAKRIGTKLNEAVRLALATDPALRQRGLDRLKALADETKSKEIADVIPQVKAYADASDRMVRAWSDVEKASVLAECRIQFARLKRPIQNFSTSLASSASNAPVVIQLPELEVIKVATTVSIPATVTK